MFEVSQSVQPSQVFPALAAAVADLPAPTPGGPALDAGARVRSLLMLHRQLGARLLAELACFDSQGLADGYGFASTASWLRRMGALDHHHAARMVSAARAVAVLPRLQERLSDGLIGVEHVEALAWHTRKVPADEVATHDETLARLATVATPSAMATAGKAIVETWRHDLAEGDASRLREVRRFDFSSTIDGLWHVDGLLPAEVGAQLAALTEPLATRRGDEDDRTPTQRRADAFAELLDGALRHAPLPDAAGERPRLTLLVDAAPRLASSVSRDSAASPVDPVGDMLGHRGLLRALVADGTLVAAFGTGSAANLVGTGTTLPAHVLARIACEADVALAVVDRGGNVLDLGRSSRFPNLAQRRALVVRDRGCVFPGCDRPPAACIAHHLRWWSAGGATDIDNLALLCHYHHHCVHDDCWQLERIEPGGPAPYGGWLARSPKGLELTEFRQPAA